MLISCAVMKFAQKESNEINCVFEKFCILEDMRE